MTDPKITPYVILVGIDLQADGERALDEAMALAAGRPPAEVHALHVAKKAPAEEEEEQLRVQNYCQAHLDKTLGKLKQLPFQRLVSHFRTGKPADQIATLAGYLDADLIVVGSHNRRGLDRVFLGSVAERLVRIAGCPVQVVRPKNHSTLGQVPEIEPLCDACLVTRQETNGERLWCERHSQHHPRAHVYNFAAGGSGVTRRRSDEPWGHTV